MSVSYTLRLPNNLKVLLDIEAAKHEQSLASYIVGACWAQLERHGGDGKIDQKTVSTELSTTGLKNAGVESVPTCMACEGSIVEGAGKSSGLWACQDVSCLKYGIEVKR